MSDAYEQSNETGLEIAVVGMSGRFPGAQNLRAFWEHLRQGNELITTFTDEELLAAGVEPEMLRHPNYVKAKSRLHDVESFDHEFFDYSPREAEMLDPQFRVFHECVWEALEDAGHVADRSSHLVGLYAGATNNLYWLARHLSPTKSPSERFQALHLNDPSFATRISYKLNLKGPSVTIQTACSTSLVAIHFACQGLLSGECDIALAGGVSINLPHTAGYLHQEGMIFSPDGHCRAFDEAASGTIFGDGAGVVVLKRLSDALADGDRIYAVVKGSAINNDGHDKVGYTAPSTSGQADVIRTAHKMSEVDPTTITYIEAHGTGTPIGDPIEIEALTQAFDTDETGFCRIGTVKSNIGHLDAAAGVAGFIKTVLALQHRELPPTLHVQRPNPAIDFANSPFVVNTALTKWEPHNAPRRAGVSAFGIGGTNAHVVLEEAPPTEASSAPNRAQQLFVLSAKSEAAVQRAADRLLDYVQAEEDVSLADIAYTLQTARTQFSHRLSFAAATRDELIAQLTLPARDAIAYAEGDDAAKSVCFLFSGQGSQYLNMGRGLYETEPIFQAALDECFAHLRPHVATDLRALLYPASGQEQEQQAQQLNQTAVAQPLLFAIEYALAKLLLSIGIEPRAMLGHSIGEYVAACLAGVFSLPDALRVVALRGRLMQAMPTGAMWSVPLAEADLRTLLPDGLVIAAINAPQMCVIAGPDELAQSFADTLREQGHQVRRLHTSHAFHSPMMAPMVEEFVQEVRQLPRHAPQLPFVSNVTGTWITAEQATDPAYWGQHLLGTVRFAEGVQTLLAEPDTVLVEVGPGNALATFARKCADDQTSASAISLLRHPQETTADSAYFIERLGRLWAAGAPLDWAALHGDHPRQRLTLPSYPFERRRFPVDGGLPFTPEALREADKRPPTNTSTTTGRPTTEPLHLIERKIADVVQEHFGFDQLRLTDNFFDLGASSLDMLTLSQKIGAAFEREIPSVTFYTYPSVRSVARWLHDSGTTITDETIAGHQHHPMEIAIIGMSGRFPGARNLAEYWDNLQNGVESISFFSDDELRESGIDPALLSHPNYVKAKGILQDVEWFDADFFDYSPREAEQMDPQFRLFHECAWEALETAGCDPDRFPGKIGVYAGTSPNYEWVSGMASALAGTEQFSSMLVNDREFFATMLAYKLNLHGPAITSQTACSTSLVNLILACQGLAAGACDVALAGGATVSLPQKVGYLYQDGMINSPDGHCRVFDDQAGGTVFGDGVGVVVLKRLQDALQDGDPVLAVVKGFGLNNDGRRKVGFTAPSTGGQADAVRQAMRMAGVAPTDISYIEAHGTGTHMGDPIELEALKEAFRTPTTDATHYCRIGSVKSNVGHLNAAAGVAGLIKTVLAMQHHLLPPTLHVQTPNPKLGLEHSPFLLNTELTPWHSEKTPLRAGVSSFGIGGTNAHVILEEAPQRPASSATATDELLVLSARSEAALEEASVRLASYLEAQETIDLAAVAHTLQLGRKPFAYRKSVLAATKDEAIAALRDPYSPAAQTDIADGSLRPVVLMFSGQGSQYVNMGRDLYETNALFRTELDRCFDLLHTQSNLDLRSVLYPALDADLTAASALLMRTDHAQPALFAFEYALAQCLLHAGVQPTALIGHSIGEYTAACLAGVMTLEDALTLVVLRGQLMEQMPTGAMLSVPLSEAELLPHLTADVSLAAVNGPALCVVSGPQEAIDRFAAQLEAAGHATRALHTSHAFHSFMMEPMLEAFEAALRTIQLHPPQIPYLSNVSGTWITAEEATDPTYYARHLRQAVRFADGAAELLTDPQTVFLEVGPGNVLTTFIRKQAARGSEPLALQTIRHPQEDASDSRFLLQKLGRLWLAGIELNWAHLRGPAQPPRLALPTYPFERERYWPEGLTGARPEALARPALQGKRPLKDWFYLPSWERALPPEPSAQPLGEHACWLIFRDRTAFGAELIARLEQTGRTVLLVDRADAYAAVDDRHYALHPGRPSDYAALCADLKRRNLVPERIVHLWNVIGDEPLSDANSWLDESQKLGYYSLLYLVQGLSKQPFSEKIRLDVLSNNMQDVLGTEDISAEKATLLGPVKVIPQEYSQIQCRSIDIVLPRPDSLQERKLLDRVSRELLADATDSIVAYRGDYRYLQTYKHVRVHAHPSAPPLLREEGVYLITGGLGGIGLVLAEYLAQTVRAKLILTGRTLMPPRDEWETYLRENGEDAPLAAKMRKVQHLEALGSEVLLVQADIADEAQMTALFATIRTRFGTLHGVAQAAGLPGSTSFRSIQDIDGQGNEEQFRSKVYGLNVLAKQLADFPLDFCLLFSSLASVLGGLGFSAYSAANLYMDAFVQRHNRHSDVQWTCANWDAWQFWESHDSTLGESLATLAILPEEGADLFQHVFSTGLEHQLIVSTGDLGIRLDQWVRGGADQQREPRRTGAPAKRKNMPQPYVPPKSGLETTLAEIWQDFLGLEQVGAQDNFFDLGASSLDIIQVTNRVNAALGSSIPVVSLFTYPTVTALAEHIGAGADDGAATAEEEAQLVTMSQGKQRLRNQRNKRMKGD